MLTRSPRFNLIDIGIDIADAGCSSAPEIGVDGEGLHLPRCRTAQFGQAARFLFLLEPATFGGWMVANEERS